MESTGGEPEDWEAVERIKQRVNRKLVALNLAAWSLEAWVPATQNMGGMCANDDARDEMRKGSPKHWATSDMRTENCGDGQKVTLEFQGVLVTRGQETLTGGGQ